MANTITKEVRSAFVKGGGVHNATVRVQVSDGIGYHIIGLPDNAVKESLLRVITALQSIGATRCTNASTFQWMWNSCGVGISPTS